MHRHASGTSSLSPQNHISLVFQLSPLGSIRESLQSLLKITTGGQICVFGLLPVFHFSKVWIRFVARWVDQYRQNWRLIAIKIILITIVVNSSFVVSIAIYKNVQIYWLYQKEQFFYFFFIMGAIFRPRRLKFDIAKCQNGFQCSSAGYVSLKYIAFGKRLCKD